MTTFSTTWPVTATGILQALAVLVALKLIRNIFRAGLVSLPGPSVAAYTNPWRVYNVWKGSAHLDAIELHKKHGNLVRVGPNHVSISDSEYIPVLYGMKEDFTKTGFYPLQAITWRREPAMNVFSTRDPVVHKTERQKLKLQESTVDLGAWIQYFAFDVVAQITSNRKMRYMDQGKDIDGIISGNDMFMAYASVIGTIPELHSLFFGNPLIRRFAPPMETWSPIVVFALKAIRENRIQIDNEVVRFDGERKDMMSKWAAVNSSNPNKMSAKDFIVHTCTNIFAGGDTTSIASFACNFLPPL